MAAVVAYVALDDGDPLALLIAAVFLVPAVGFGRMAAGALHAGLLMGEGHVHIRNPAGEEEVSAGAVDRFEAGIQPSRIGNGTPGIIAVMRDGSMIDVWTLARECLVWNFGKHVDGWRGTAEQLNRLLGEVQRASDARQS